MIIQALAIVAILAAGLCLLSLLSTVLDHLVLGNLSKHTPKPGERWVLRWEGPWLPETPGIVEILDVKDKWVLYKYPNITDLRMPLNEFRRLFEKVQ